ncbi:MAG: hypothetical protein V1877_01795 [Candidatus Tagabacteria bacterium]
MIQLKERLREFLDSDKGSAKATKIILAVLAVVGVLAIATMAPNIFQIFGRYKKSRRYSDKQLRNAFYTLKRRNFIEVLKEKDEKIIVRLTKKGKQYVREFSIDNLSILKPKKWDKKWRIVIFDIPNKFNMARLALRNKIKELGFYKLQKSVWIYPYPCEDEILFIANFFNVESFIEILTVESLLREDKIKKIFHI